MIENIPFSFFSDLSKYEGYLEENVWGVIPFSFYSDLIKDEDYLEENVWNINFKFYKLAVQFVLCSGRNQGRPKPWRWRVFHSSKSNNIVWTR